LVFVSFSAAFLWSISRGVRGLCLVVPWPVFAASQTSSSVLAISASTLWLHTIDVCYRVVNLVYNVIGGIIVSLSRAAIGVLLYLPIILRRHWFWTL
jgi:hypothetical protein